MSKDDSDKKFDIDSYWVSIQGKWQKQAEPVKLKVDDKIAGANFKRDLAKGQKSELDFHKRYEHCLVRTDGRRGDFEVLKTGAVIELKSDYHDPRKTKNFFLERFSYDDKPGGIWQSVDHGVEYFVYWFPVTGETFYFNAKKLLRKVIKLTRKMDLIDIKNENHVTRGYLVERELLRNLFLEPEEVGLYDK